MHFRGKVPLTLDETTGYYKGEVNVTGHINFNNIPVASVTYDYDPPTDNTKFIQASTNSIRINNTSIKIWSLFDGLRYVDVSYIRV